MLTCLDTYLTYLPKEKSITDWRAHNQLIAPLQAATQVMYYNGQWHVIAASETYPIDQAGEYEPYCIPPGQCHAFLVYLHNGSIPASVYNTLAAVAGRGPARAWLVERTEVKGTNWNAYNLYAIEKWEEGFPPITHVRFAFTDSWDKDFSSEGKPIIKPVIVTRGAIWPLRSHAEVSGK